MKFDFPSTRISVLQKMAGQRPARPQRLVVVGGPLKSKTTACDTFLRRPRQNNNVK